MGRVIVTPKAEDARPVWRQRASLTQRILVVNLFALLLSGGSIFYLDAFRTRLLAERLIQTQDGARIVASMLARATPRARATILDAAGRASGDRLRLYNRDGRLIVDTWETGPRTFYFVDPATDGFTNRSARWMDAAVDRVVRATIPPPFIDHGKARADRWPELRCAIAGGTGTICGVERLAPDRTAIMSAAIALDTKPATYLLSIRDARDATGLVRAERFRLFGIVFTALVLSLALSTFLARTIVRPLQALTRAAVRVRGGRDRDVVVPRLPERGDEIGVLARAVADMAEALRTRIDNSERFAADVSHELRNPLASLASAMETMERIDDPAMRAELMEIASADVRRLDRLITDIAALSRLDAQLSRSAFVPVDLNALLGELAEQRNARGGGTGAIIDVHGPRAALTVPGDPERLSRAIGNMLDNALSFSRAGQRVTVTIASGGEAARIAIEDQGPGVPASARAQIFERFHSDRPDGHAFGAHSGLGLAIAKTIIDGHNGAITVEDRESGAPGARFVVRLPTGSPTATA